MLTYEELFEEHKEDYRTLFARVEFQLDGVEKFDVIPTNERIERAAKETPDIGLAKCYLTMGDICLFPAVDREDFRQLCREFGIRFYSAMGIKIYNKY